MHDNWYRRTLWASAVGFIALATWSAGLAPAGGAKGAAKVKEGRPAPNVDLPATQIETVLPDKKDAKTLKLSDLKGKKNVVLYFFPKALTGG
jgi:hypothetical protein